MTTRLTSPPQCGNMVLMEQFQHTSEGAVTNLDAREYVAILGGIGIMAAAQAMQVRGFLGPCSEPPAWWVSPVTAVVALALVGVIGVLHLRAAWRIDPMLCATTIRRVCGMAGGIAGMMAAGMLGVWLGLPDWWAVSIFLGTVAGGWAGDRIGAALARALLRHVDETETETAVVIEPGECTWASHNPRDSIEWLSLDQIGVAHDGRPRT